MGLSRHAIDRRLKAARLHSLYRGVYLVGHSVPAPGRVSWAPSSRAGPAPALRSLVEADARPALTRSETEERLLALIRTDGLPQPEVNARVGGHEVEFVWRSQRLVVEVDGFRFHSSRAAFERDRIRDGELAAMGFWVVRIPWRQLIDGPDAVMARFAAALRN
jgi:very-short-patch-repair endonuclease